MSEKEIAVQKPKWYDMAVASFRDLAEKFKNITSVEQLPEARDVLNAIADKSRAVKEMLAEPKKKAHDAHKSITKLEKDLLAPLEELDSAIRKSLGEFANREEAARMKREREQRELAAIVNDLGDFEDDAEPVAAVVAEPKVAVSGLHFRDDWRWSITDVYLIPRRYLIPDARAIQALVDQMNARAETACPGIKVYAEKVPVRR